MRCKCCPILVNLFLRFWSSTEFQPLKYFIKEKHCEGKARGEWADLSHSNTTHKDGPSDTATDVTKRQVYDCDSYDYYCYYH